MGMKFEYFLGETFASLRRNLLMTLAAIMTVAVSLFLLGGVMVLREIVSKTIRGAEEEIEVNVFLRDDITPEQSQTLQTLALGMPEVRGVKYMSKEDAFNEFKDWYKETPALVENVDRETLPASYVVQLRRPDSAEVVAGRFEGQPGVEEVQWGGDDVKKVISLFRLVQRGTFTAVVFILLAAALLIANTIRLAIYARRREIAIMKLVGATNWFVRVPFILEGMAEGVIGAIIAGGIVFASKFLLLDGLQENIVFVPLTVGADSLFRILALLVAVGATVGAIGAGLALRRFLEV